MWWMGKCINNILIMTWLLMHTNYAQVDIFYFNESSHRMILFNDEKRLTKLN